MQVYAETTGRAWFLLPTLALVEHQDGERMVGLIWLNLEIGVRWYP